MFLAIKYDDIIYIYIYIYIYMCSTIIINIIRDYTIENVSLS